MVIDPGKGQILSSSEKAGVSEVGLLDLDEVVDVVTAAGVDGNEFFFESAEVTSAKYGIQTDVDSLSLGHISGRGETKSGRITVTVSDGTGAAASAPGLELTVTMAHELLGHALLQALGKPWLHDDGGSVDSKIRDIEDRTRRLP